MATNQARAPRAKVDTSDPKVNFKRRAGGYVNTAAEAIQKLGDLAASRTVEYTADQAEKAFAFIEQELTSARAKFKSGGKAAKAGFTLD